LTRDEIRPTSQVILYPGYRLDTLVYFDQPGKYCLINDQTWRRVPNDYRVLGILDVSGKAAPVGDVTEHLRQTLIGAAYAKIADQQVRDRVVDDLSKGLRLSSFRWHEPVRDEELTGHQSAMFSIIDHDDGSATLSIDGKPFDHDRVDRTLTLGNAEEWELTSNLANHPFHIHVNPFQVTSIRDEEGRDVTIEGADAFDPDYAGIVGGWRDTIIVKRGYKVTMRTRYRRFIGDFVMHCHFASHGDAGMMQRISMVLPDAAAAPHAGH
jgi:FtsP/CotA-like multicopper oxidase with cupredoxin domain